MPTDLPKDAGEQALARLDRLRNANGGTSTAELRLRMQQAMQNDCAVFRNGRCWRRAAKHRSRSGKAASDIRVTDRSLIWNTDLVETLEFDNLIAQAAVTILSADTEGKPRRACARGLPQPRRRELDEAHAGLGRDGAKPSTSTIVPCTRTR